MRAECLKVFIVSVAWALASCAIDRSDVVERPDVLTDFVLVIEEGLDGQVRSSWRPVADFKPSDYIRGVLSDDEVGAIIHVSSRPRDCDQEQIKCYRDCKKSRLPSQLNHIKRGSRAHSDYCAEECLKKYMDCLKLEKIRALEFSATGAAVAWLERHRKEILVGTVVVIAGVAFVAISGGAGLLILAPVVWMAS